MSYRNFWKPVIDFTAALLMLLPVAFVAACVALAIRFTMGGPVLFRQVRVGRDGQTFTLLKFRTMRDATDADGRPLPDEKRLTRLGMWIRKLSLDELPQLWNVLRGEMSLIGPRPLPTKYVSRYSAEQNRRHEVKPGITGWAQVNGRNAIEWEEKFRLDVWYVDNVRAWTDLKIIGRTILTLIVPRGIGHGDRPTMHEFKGNQPLEPTIEMPQTDSTDRRAA